MRRSPFGASSASSAHQPAVLVEQFFGPVAPHPLFEHLQMLGLASPTPQAAPGASETCLRSVLPSTAFGPGPSFRRAQHDHRPARALLEPVLPRVALNASNLGDDRVERRGHRADASRPDRRLRRNRACSRSRETALRVLRAECAPARSGWRSCSRSNAGSAAPRHRATGLRNLFECQLAASGPVSASPSPTTQRDQQSGLSNAAP